MRRHRDEIDRTLAEMKSDETLDTLVKEYISDYEKQENKDVPEGAITTQPYYSDLMIPVTLKER